MTTVEWEGCPEWRKWLLHPAIRHQIQALIFVKLFIKKKFRALGGGEPGQA